MAVPKKKTSKSRVTCVVLTMLLMQPIGLKISRQGEPVRRHHVDLKTGMYRGRQGY